jgi:hypothetical protein
MGCVPWLTVTLEEMKSLDCPFSLRVVESGNGGGAGTAPAEVGRCMFTLSNPR